MNDQTKPSDPYYPISAKELENEERESSKPSDADTAFSTFGPPTIMPPLSPVAAMDETPRTNQQALVCVIDCGNIVTLRADDPTKGRYVEIDFARQLERELNFEREDNEELREANHALGPQLRDALRELAAANRALEAEREEFRKLDEMNKRMVMQLTAYSVNPDRITQTEIAMARTANGDLYKTLELLSKERDVRRQLAGDVEVFETFLAKIAAESGIPNDSDVIDGRVKLRTHLAASRALDAVSLKQEGGK